MQNLVNQFKTDTKRFVAAPVKAAHRAWIVRLSNLIKGKESFSAESVSQPTECDFGKWYYNEGNKLFGNSTTFRELEEIHDQIHQTAKEITQFHHDGNDRQAAKQLGELTSLTRELCSKLDQLESETAGEKGETVAGVQLAQHGS